jgi:MSHA pilin protein MshC
MLADPSFWGRHNSRNPPKGGFLPLAMGFTLVELLVTIILIGIVSVVALSRISQGAAGIDERSFRDGVASGLRYAQKSAIAAHRRVCVTFTVNSASFAIAKEFTDLDCTGGDSLLGIDGTGKVSANGSAAFSAVPGDIVFDAGGRPGAAATISIAGLDAALDITVAAETGYVQ